MRFTADCTWSRPLASASDLLGSTSLNGSTSQPAHLLTANDASTESQRLPIRHLNQLELSRRWRVSTRTLERWRWLRQGPRYLKVGGRVIYRLEDIEAYEVAQLHEGVR
jgi:hypothetical protein